MIKNIVFDIGNVLVDFGWERFFKKFDLTDEEFNRIVAATVKSPLWNEIDRGVMTEDEIIEGFIKNDPEMEDKLREMYADFNGLLTCFDYTRGWIIDLKNKGYKVYCLSNMSYKAIRECGDALSFLDSVDGYILSCNEKVIKPDEKIYERLFKKLSLKPEECMFFDDSQANVDTANRLKMHAFVFTDLKTAVNDIERVTKEEAAKTPFESKYSKKQRVGAVICLAIIALLYLCTLVLTFINADWAKSLLRVSLGCTLVLPILTWLYIWMIGMLTHKDTIASVHLFRNKDK